MPHEDPTYPLRARYGLLLVAAILAILILTLPASSATTRPAKLILISWDAAGDWIIDRLLAEGKLPNVARLAKGGVHAEYVIPPFPSVTAAGHAALWTGTPPHVNGIIYNSVPPLPWGQHTVLDKVDGFSSRQLLVEPVWMSAVKSGRRALLLSATQSEPFEVYYTRMKSKGIPTGHLTGVEDRFTRPLAPAAVYKYASEPKSISGLPPRVGGVRVFTVHIGDSDFVCCLFDAVNDPKIGYDTCAVKNADGKGIACLLKTGWSTPGTVDKFSPRIEARFGAKFATIRFRLFSLAPDGSFLFYHTPAKALSFSGPPPRAFPLASWGEGVVPFDLYEQGKLGVTIPAGGSGVAEKRLLELVRLSVGRLREETRAAIRGGRWELLMHYSSLPDTFEHAIMGYLDPESRAYRANVAAKLWPYLAQLYLIHDDWLGEILRLRTRDTAVALVSDHGMQGVSREFYTNTVLKNAGLLALDSEGNIDLSRTKALAPPWYPGFGVVVNDTSWKSGIVRPEDRTKVITAIEKALIFAVDPQTGRRPVKSIYLSPNDLLSLGGPRTVDMVFDLQPDYTAESILMGVVACDIAKKGRGMHGFAPWRPKMRCVFYAAGPGLKRGSVLPPMQSTGVVPMLCDLLGWPAPGTANAR